LKRSVTFAEESVGMIPKTSFFGQSATKIAELTQKGRFSKLYLEHATFRRVCPPCVWAFLRARHGLPDYFSFLQLA
jgi:hypothetical protein